MVDSRRLYTTELLWTLGGRASWFPEELAPWLSGTVLSMLTWSIESEQKAGG
jgi:hypothetical protein